MIEIETKTSEDPLSKENLLRGASPKEYLKLIKENSKETGLDEEEIKKLEKFNQKRLLIQYLFQLFSQAGANETLLVMLAEKSEEMNRFPYWLSENSKRKAARRYMSSLPQTWSYDMFTKDDWDRLFGSTFWWG